MKLSTRDGMAVSIGIEFVLSVLLCLGAGYWVDKKLGSAPWGVLVGTVVGAAAGFRSLWRVAQRGQRAETAATPEPRATPSPEPHRDSTETP